MRFRALRQSQTLLIHTSIIFFCVLLGSVHAQQDSLPTPATVTPALLEARISGIQSSTTIDDGAKAQIVQLYTQSQEQLKAADEWRAQADQFAQLRSSAPEQMKARQDELVAASTSISPEESEALKKELAAISLLTSSDAQGKDSAPGGQAEPDPSSSMSLADIEVKVSEIESALTTAQTVASEIEQESARRTERRRQLPSLQVDARSRMEAARTQLGTAPGNGEGVETTEARRLLNEAKVLACEQELRSYTEEMNSYDARGRLLALRLDLATRNLQRTRTLSDAWHDVLAKKRQEEARKAEVAARDAMLESSNAPIQVRELVKRLATENLELTQERAGPIGLPREIERSTTQVKAAEARLEQLDNDFKTLKNKVDAAGSRSLVGFLLRSHRRNLPDIKELEKEMAKRRDKIASVQIKQIEIDEQYRELVSIGNVVSSVLSGLSTTLNEVQRNTISGVLNQHYATRKDLLYEKSRDLEDYFNELLKLEAVQVQLIDQTKTIDTYIGERVLWVRSGNTFGWEHLKDAREAILWLGDEIQLAEVLDVLRHEAKAAPVPVALTCLSLILLFGARRPLRRRLHATVEQINKKGNTQLSPTIRATLQTFLLSLDVPLALAMIGWRLSASLFSTDFSSAVGHGLFNAALLLWSLDFMREVLKRNGLGTAHFGWSVPASRSIYRTLLWLEVLTIPMAVVIATLTEIPATAGLAEASTFSTLSELPESRWELSLGRICFMFIMFLMIITAHRLLRKQRGALMDLVEHAMGRSNLLARRLGYTIGVATPLALLVAAALGFHHSAVHIAAQLQISLVSLFCLIIAMQLVLRWVVMARKILARDQARKRLEALRESATTESDITVEKEHQIDLDRIDAQTMRLVKSGFVIALAVAGYLIWSSDLPALSVLDNVELWSTTDTIQTEEPVADSDEVTLKTETISVPITLRNAAFFLFISVITFIAVQNLPGLLEIILLQRLSLIAGERYAINSIMGYIITIIGVTWAFSTVGLSWNKVQWLVAAVGLGLGFGLQEIFANLVSGLIILFERPIRVGDTVTVGDISGTVSRIRIRATWITAFNRQELIVPNKEFVTGRLVNWTLSDQILRVEIPVGIAYGSDTELARKLILEVANKNTRVLQDPEPVVFFTGFGDSSLDFELRVHSPDLESFLIIKDAMHTGIDNAFREHGIEIPFPQRDLHVRSIESALSVVKPDDIPTT